MRQIPRQGHFLSPATAATGRLVLAEILDLESFPRASEHVPACGMEGWIEGEATLDCAVKENEEDGMSVGGWKEGPCGWIGAFTPSCSHLRTRHGSESTSLPLHSDLGRSLDWDDAQTTKQGCLEISGFMIQSVRPDHLGGVPAVFYLYT